jgi:hypothetical protein
LYHFVPCTTGATVDATTIIVAMWKLATVLFVVAADALACTTFPTVYTVPHSFSVHVSNEIGPVVGLKLKVVRFKWKEFNKLSDEQQRHVSDVTPFEEVFAESTTDAAGMAHFGLNKTGSFTLSADSPADRLSWVELKVSDQSQSSLLEVKWPSNLILRTAQLRGKLARGLFSSRSAPIKSNALMLRTLIGYRDIAATVTDENGVFDFTAVGPGFYFLQVVATTAKTEDFYKPEGNIAIYVAPESPRNALMISTINTSCGLSYDLEENKARYKPIACFKGDKPVKCEY